MLVCICNGISDSDIENAIYEGASSYKDVQKQLGVGDCCGQCARYAKSLVSDAVSQLQMSKAFHLATEIAC